ncbi:MAG TPA: fibronectin type III domain-containing protein [Kofleriaceae bacterium]|nr:fibronectin type III domain-containing protein [Kofleriaceae bacterium]
MAVSRRGLDSLARLLSQPSISALRSSLRHGRRSLVAAAAVVPAVVAGPARADDAPTCRVVNIQFTPGGIPAGMRPPAPSVSSPEIAPQIVAWLERPSGEFVQTIFITQQTGRYGLGNRPGRFDFNSGPNWPYGRRVTVFPVWAGRNHQAFPQLEFQDGFDSDLSHSSANSSRELHFCRPLLTDETQWDAASCSSTVYTDKGKFGVATTGYPPRADLITAAGIDSSSVDMYRAMNPFDAVTQATPRIGELAQFSWPMPGDLLPGDYVLYAEVSLEQDFNDSYNPTVANGKFGSPKVSYGEYGVPYRGQPSVVYRVPFQIADTETTASTDRYYGYGDPDGASTLHPPDTTITDAPNTGSGRLLLTSKDGEMFRLRVDARPERDVLAPSPPGEMVVSDPSSSGAVLTFRAPGDDGMLGNVTGYEVRYLVGDVALTDEAFAEAHQVAFTGEIVSAGQAQQLTIKDLLPETRYTVAVRAFDNCHNTSTIARAAFTTGPRKIGEVDACFVATAAYGSLLANDVEMLRRFRDLWLKRSVLGELAVETYYTFGPPVAGVVGESDLLRAAARDMLTPIVNRVRGLRFDR